MTDQLDELVVRADAAILANQRVLQAVESGRGFTKHDFEETFGIPYYGP